MLGICRRYDSGVDGGWRFGAWFSVGRIGVWVAVWCGLLSVGWQYEWRFSAWLPVGRIALRMSAKCFGLLSVG